MNIPKYRAKKIDSDEYVIGYVSPQGFRGCDGLYIYIEDKLDECYEIDQSTLAINFPDMLDSENNPIFASLREDGKGGDIIDFPHHKETLRYLDFTFKLGEVLDLGTVMHVSKEWKIIGIQK